MVNPINLLDFLAHVNYGEDVDIFTVDETAFHGIYSGNLNDIWNDVNPYFLKTYDVVSVESGRDQNESGTVLFIKVKGNKQYVDFIRNITNV